MNNTIKELIEQSKLSDSAFNDQDKLEKFAELIIDECIKMAESAPLHHCYTTFDRGMAWGTKHDIVKFMKLSLKWTNTTKVTYDSY